MAIKLVYPLGSILGPKLAEARARRPAPPSLTEAVQSALDPGLRRHVLAAAYDRHQVLVITVDCAVYISRVRRAENPIRRRLKSLDFPAPARLLVVVGGEPLAEAA